MKIGWVGVHAEGIPALQAVCEAEYDVVGLMTLRQEKAERRCGSGSYEGLCDRFKIPMFEVAHVNDSDSIDILKAWDCDVLVVLGWGQILCPDALRQARIGVVGAHASLLPHNRGSAPVNWAIIRDEKETGNSLIWLAEGVDAGDLIAQRSFPITSYDTCATIYDSVAESNREMLLELLRELEWGERPGLPQAEQDSAILPRRRPNDGLIDWTRSSREIYNLIRAVTHPYPGAFAYLNGQAFRVWKAALLPLAQSPGEPGSILGPVNSPDEQSCGLLVATGDGAIVLLEIEDESGHLLNGRQLSEITQQNWTGRQLRNAA